MTEMYYVNVFHFENYCLASIVFLLLLFLNMSLSDASKISCINLYNIQAINNKWFFDVPI